MEVPEDVFLEEIEFYELGEEQIRLYREKEGFIIDREDMLLPQVSYAHLFTHLLFPQKWTQWTAEVVFTFVCVSVCAHPQCSGFGVTS